MGFFGSARSYLLDRRLLILGLACVCHGQIEVLPIKRIGVEQGLSNGTVWSVLQNRQGFLWVGTSSGLNRYDGYEFRPIQTDQTRNALEDGQIRALYEQEDGILWVGSANGLTCLDPSTGAFETYQHEEDDPNSLSNDHITGLVRAGAGQLWVSTMGGLDLFDTRSRRAIHYREDENSPMSLSNDTVRTLLVDPDGTLWVGTDWGLNRMEMRSGRFERFFHDENQPGSLCHNQVRSLCRDGAGRLWVGTSNGISILDPGASEFRTLRYVAGKASPVMDNWINVIRADHQGRVWIGTRSGGLSVLDPAKGVSTHYLANDELRAIPTNNIISLYFDENGLLWVGTYNNGLLKFDLKMQKFKNYRIALSESLTSSNTNAIYQANDGTVYLGNTTGLSWRDLSDGGIRQLSLYNGLPSSSVISIAGTADGLIWLGTYGGGVVKLDPKRQRVLQVYLHEAGGLPNNVVNVFLLDGDLLWAGTRAGLAFYQADRDKFVQAGPKLPEGLVLDVNTKALIRDRQGRFWLGTHTGLWCWEPETGALKAYRGGASVGQLCSDFVTQVIEDSRGRIWVGTSDGLNMLDPQTGVIVRYQQSQGFPDNWVSAIAEGQPGELWISGNQGLARFRPPELIQFFDHRDGLQSSEFLMGSVFANKETGTLFFGGLKGYNTFNPSRMPFNPTKPRLALTAFRVFDREINLAKKMDEEGWLVLRREENFFSFEFAGLDFTAPEKNVYAYRLKGFESAFNQVGSRRYASYTNIKGGDYLFQVMVANSDGIWTGADLEIPVRILPFYWETKWFRILAVLALVLSMLGLHAYRLRRVHRRRRVLGREVDLRTAALRVVHQKMVDDARKAGIAEVTTGMLHNMGNILNSVSISAGEITRVLKNSKLQRLEMANEMMPLGMARPLAFFEEDAKGKLLPLFLEKVTHSFRTENEKMDKECQILLDKIGLMANAVSMEQSYAGLYVKVESVQLAELIEHALRLMESSLEKRGIEVQRDLEPVSNCCLEPHKLVHVITNLLKNAIDALSRPDQESPRLKIQVRPAGPGFHEIIVKDNGCGISPESLTNLFEFGFTTKVHGHGFGLHSCRATMREMGGDIWLESAGVGKGAKFTVRVPIHSATAGMAL